MVVAPFDKAILDEITTLDMALTEILSVGKPDALGSCAFARRRRSGIRGDDQCETDDQCRSQLNYFQDVLPFEPVGQIFELMSHAFEC